MGSIAYKLKESAHKLALEHNPQGSRNSAKAFWNRIETDIDELQSFIKELHEHNSACVQPAEEWLLDHSEFLEAEIVGIREEFARMHMDSLFTVGKDTRLRVSSICESYLENTDGLLDEEVVLAFFTSYQEVSVLSIAEAWSIPLFMKIALIRRLANIMKPVRERHDICKLVERMLSGISIVELTPERLKNALEEMNVELPLSGALIVHLVKHLREHAENSAHIGEWLICKLENSRRAWIPYFPMNTGFNLNIK